MLLDDHTENCPEADHGHCVLQMRGCTEVFEGTIPGMEAMHDHVVADHGVEAVMSELLWQQHLLASTLILLEEDFPRAFAKVMLKLLGEKMDIDREMQEMNL